jgi:hypothetical protein|tara:strand:- start:1488 stop:1622 length:135 start_codon:yes stop_codon:yes gene_type:complete
MSSCDCDCKQNETKSKVSEYNIPKNIKFEFVNKSKQENKKNENS